jgi:hypothetical protein
LSIPAVELFSMFPSGKEGLWDISGTASPASRASTWGVQCGYAGKNFSAPHSTVSGSPGSASQRRSKFSTSSSPRQHAWRILDALQKGTPNASDRSSEQALKSRFTIDILKSYILCWPLIASCSIRLASQGGSFCPAYTVPQMLLQWGTRKKEVDGMSYFSVRTPSGAPYIYALPTWYSQRGPTPAMDTARI